MLQWFKFVRNKTTAISNEDKNLLGIQTCCSWGNSRLLLLLGVSSQNVVFTSLPLPQGIRPWTKSSQIYFIVSVLCRLNLSSMFNSYLLLSWTFISVETAVCTAGLRFQGVMQKGASEVFYPYQCAKTRCFAEHWRGQKVSFALCGFLWIHRCGLHCLEHKLFVLIYKLKIKPCLFASVEGSFAHSCLKSELWLPSKIKFNVTSCAGKGRTGNYPASGRTL